MTTDRVAVAVDAAKRGADVALEGFRSAIDVETKDGKTDVVTQADYDAQRRATATIREAFPDDPIVGEEEDALKSVPSSGPAWVIDPIDGTNNFVRDVRFWATSVAAVADGEPVAAANVLPALGDVFVADADGVRRNGEPVTVSDRTDPETFTVAPTIWWGRDRRNEYAAACREIVTRFGDLGRYGSAQGTLSLIASGSIDGAITNVETNPWDTIAGVYLVRRAGGVVTDLEGERWSHDSTGLVASNGGAHDELLAAARAVANTES
ncbi:inositol monophosphatase [Salinadaptatus halalkaliphilus]|uniref:fructose-bisphosphatase n=1 Tax=Salinadaptatus halalkaliphilus TaxID=2419781 RepID=A0A4S3TT46_9EURY|nr:inositol monophosphatase [Salinadaptatus halalkaliphilus]THE66635.1 inositol monophosphatase [Salinadaptatus halalkaliphilus]